MQSILVFCGSSLGADPKYAKLAYDMGSGIAKSKNRLIYGGATCGLMGRLAQGAIDHEGAVVGYIPKSFADFEIAHQGLSELHEVPNMHIRKAKMYEACDIAVTLPGGSGSMDEFFEFLVWRKLNLHDKKLVLFNAWGYYDDLLKLINKMSAEGFMGQEDKNLFKVISGLDEFWTFLGT